MEDKKIRIAISHGDTNGIGYELIFKTFSNPDMLELCTPIIYGSPKVAAYHRNALDIAANFSIINSADEAQDGKLNMLPVFDDEVKVEFGMPTAESAVAAYKALDKAITDYKNGLFDVLVAAPVDGGNLHVDGYDFTSDRFIEMCVGEGKKGLSILVNDNLRVASLTSTDTPMSAVPQAIEKDNIINKVSTFFNSLLRDFNISMPRIAILAFNPLQANGEQGEEERNAIIPAIEQLEESGIRVFGPYNSEKFFSQEQFYAFDGIFTMYHAQGVTPVKALVPEGGVRFLAGLPLVSATPDEEATGSIAGQGIANEQSFRDAIYLAIDAFRNRIHYDKPMEHPLPKLYHEKRDESEKVRFAIPKKHEHTERPRQNVPNNGHQSAKS